MRYETVNGINGKEYAATVLGRKVRIEAKKSRSDIYRVYIDGVISFHTNTLTAAKVLARSWIEDKEAALLDALYENHGADALDALNALLRDEETPRDEF